MVDVRAGSGSGGRSGDGSNREERKVRPMTVRLCKRVGRSMGKMKKSMEKSLKSVRRRAAALLRKGGESVQGILDGALRQARRCLSAVYMKIRILASRPESGAATAEYAVVLIAATAFAGVLLVLLKSDTVRSLLASLLKKALTVS